MIHLVLYQPDIPQNLGAVLRLAACMGAQVHVIEPCGFPLSDQRLKRAGMDYIDHVALTRHPTWEDFLAHRTAHPGRLLLLETDGTTRYTDIAYRPSDYIVLGSESAGTPRALYAQMDATLTIPMKPGLRSLNIAISAAILTAETCRQLDWAFA
ncbi:MAG: tRNA (cytidine(34)-2'-O)-methyltransferase [Pseudomonadota bacterium]